MQAWIFSDEAYTEQYHALYTDFIEEWFMNGNLETLITDTAQLLLPYVEKDPTKFCAVEEFDTGVDAMMQFVALRTQAVSRQLEGDTTLVETGDLNLSDMGSMGGDMDGKMGGGKMPQDDNRPFADKNGNNNEEMPTMPPGMKMEDENVPAGDFDPSGFAPDSNPSGSRPAINDFKPDEGAFGAPSENSELFKWGLVGMSVLILGVGLLIALKKKY